MKNLFCCKRRRVVPSWVRGAPWTGGGSENLDRGLNVLDRPAWFLGLPLQTTFNLVTSKLSGLEVVREEENRKFRNTTVAHGEKTLDKNDSEEERARCS